MLQSTVKSVPYTTPDTPLRKLTVESNALINTLIQRAVDEEGLEPSWTVSIKHALAGFGECVESGHWLTGVRMARTAQNVARILEEKADKERIRKEHEQLNELKAGKPKPNDKAELKKDDVKMVLSKEERRSLALRELRELTSIPPNPALLSPKHLLITVSFQSTELQDGDAEYDLLPALNHCIFLPGMYAFPFFDDEDRKQEESGIVLYGLENWEYEVKPRVIGGNFVFRALSSATTHESLAAVLRLCIYTYLSLILEQDLLSNSHVALQFLPPPPPPPPTPIVTPLHEFPTLLQSRARTRSSKTSSGIWSFLSKKTEGIFHRHSSNLGGSSPHASPIDLDAVPSSSKPFRRLSDAAPPKPESTPDATSGSLSENEGRLTPFGSAVREIQHPECILSTSPGVRFPLPPLLARLANKEQKRPASGSESSSLASSILTTSSSISSAGTAVPATGIRLSSTEKAGLGSLLGWEGREAQGKGMVSIRGFVRQQGLTVLYAEHVSPEVQCGRPRLVTYRYWARSRAEDAEADRTLGGFVERTCETAGELCEVEGCDKLREQHSLSWTCSGMKISGDVMEDKVGVADGENITMWESCTLCGQSTGRLRMGDGTYLFSFAKFLELLLWSPMLASLSLCEHTKTSPASPIETQFCVVRHFSWRGRVLIFRVTSIRDSIFEVRVPKLQIIPGTVPKEEKQQKEAQRKRDGEEEKQALFTEMDEWWKVFKTRLDKLDAYLQEEIHAAIEGKDLPPLPMSDDEDLKEDTLRSGVSDRLHTPSPQRPQASYANSFVPQINSRSNTPIPKSNKPAAPYPPGLLISINQSCQLLQRLRSSFQKTEDTIRQQVADDPQLTLNDVRRIFRSTARGAFKRLVAWQNKHVPGAPGETWSDHEPEWWQRTCHAIPGGRVLVREGEWGSVISFTLSSLDYQRELANLSSSSLQQPTFSSTTNLSDLLAPVTTVTAKILKSVSPGPDPDEAETPSLWEEPESWTAVISRREHPRDMSALLSLRDVLRNKKSFESSSLGSRFSGLVSRGVSPPSAWTQPQVQVNLQCADGQVTHIPEAAEEVERVLGFHYPVHHHMESTFNSDDVPTPTPSSFVETNIRSGNSASIISLTQVASDEHQENASGLEYLSPGGLSEVSPLTRGHGPEPSSATSASSLASALSGAMRYFLNAGSPTSSSSSSPTSHSAPHHRLLGLETTPIDDRPHIKYDWTIGKRLKFSCTVYYAKQFDSLRKRCGVDDSIMRSLERTENWAAIGGKSKSNFWKSSDDRFIIKTLVNAWNVADLQVLIDLGPAYFRYIESTATKPSVLAKLMGFYTVEIKNLETGAVQAKADLLVMENLFYNQKISKKFDLKGIQSRRVKPSGDHEQRTLFDGEWIDSQHRTPLLIHPHSKLILQESIKADAEFLARSNIMDYSLLLGVDEDRHEMACGLVDTIGSYTFAKTLEYKAKQNLNSGKGKEVTVMPPAEYQSRFVNAIEGYFLACPDKWTKPQRYLDRRSSHDLPSVL